MHYRIPRCYNFLKSICSSESIFSRANTAAALPTFRYRSIGCYRGREYHKFSSGIEGKRNSSEDFQAAARLRESWQELESNTIKFRKEDPPVNESPQNINSSSSTGSRGGEIDAGIDIPIQGASTAGVGPKTGCAMAEETAAAGGTKADGTKQQRKLNIVVEGCCHGELPNIYASVQRMEKAQGVKVDLLICCGDFQCLRNTDDFHGLACPDKYKQLGTFHKYYSGELKAPYLTIFIGGNHEASTYLQELHYGGWVAPRIYFMGFAGVIRVGGVRIAGLTGIFNPRSYREGRHEKPPYTQDTLRTVYYVRELEIFKLAQLTGHVDLCLSHDWPRGIARYGDAKALFRAKPFFKQEVEDNTLGSAAAEQLLHKIQPDYWFSAHLHVKFAAVVRHDVPRAGQGRPDAEVKGVTRFLSLDKCLPRRDFLQLISVPRPDGEGGKGNEVLVEHDVEWLSILKASHHILTNARKQVTMPYETPRVPESDKAWVRDRLAARGLREGPLVISNNFKITAPPESELHGKRKGRATPELLPNPQTDELLSLLGLDHVVTIPCRPTHSAGATGISELDPEGALEAAIDPNEIDLEAAGDPNEIQLEEL